MMNRLFKLLILCAVALFAACGGAETPEGGQEQEALSVTISGLVENYGSASVKIIAKSAKWFAYKVEAAAEVNEAVTAEQIFASGKVGASAQSGTNTFTVSNLLDNTSYVLYVAAKSEGGELSSVATRIFKTKAMDEFAVTSKSQTEINVSVRIPESVPTTSVIKWALTDLASYNHAGGDSGQLVWLNRNEAIYENYFKTRQDFAFNESSRTFTKGGQSYSHFNPLLPGQPAVLLLAEFAEGSHSEWGAGYYTPFYGEANAAGYYRKEVIVTTKPVLVSSKPTVIGDIRPSGKGAVLISMPSDLVCYYYMVLNDEQYAEVLRLLDGNESYLQWFVTSPLAAERFGAKRASGNVSVDIASLNLSTTQGGKALVTALGTEDGSRQSFTSVNLVVPDAAPAKANNVIIAHRGGSKEGNVPDNSIASLKYAISLGCAASETDIYWTKDNQVVVAHANSECKINGLYPWESTLAEIQAAGRLSNGEIVPSLQDYIRAAMSAKGSCTKLCLDVKSIDKPTYHHAESVKACQRACEIIAEMEAQAWCQFIISGYDEIAGKCVPYANAVGIEIGSMGKHSASKLKNWGYTWYNRSKDYGISESEINGYLNAGLKMSVYTIDSEADWEMIASYHTKLCGITTNYPKKLLEKTKK